MSILVQGFQGTYDCIFSALWYVKEGDMQKTYFIFIYNNFVYKNFSSDILLSVRRKFLSTSPFPLLFLICINLWAEHSVTIAGTKVE